MGLINLVRGLDRITIAEPQKYYVYKYKGEWYTKEALVSRTNKEKSWTDTNKNTTKYRRLTQENLWSRVSIDVELDIAAPIWEGYSITTNGVVLGINNKEVGGKGQQVIIGAGELRGNYFKSDLMWKAFIDNDYEPTERRTWVAGIQKHEWTQFINSSKISLDEIEIKQTIEKKVKQLKPTSKAGKKVYKVLKETKENLQNSDDKNAAEMAQLFETMVILQNNGMEVDWDVVAKSFDDIIDNFKGKEDPSPQTIVGTPGEILFGTTPEVNTPEVDTPEPQFSQQYQQLQASTERYEEPTNLNGSAPQTKIITVSGRQKRRFN